MGQRLMRIGERGGPGIDDVFARHQHAGLRLMRELRFALAQFIAVDVSHVNDAIRMGLGDDAIELRLFVGVPCNDESRTLHQWQVQPVADVEIFGIARPHAGQFSAARGRIEPRMEQRAVALGGAAQDVRAAFQQNAGQARHGEAPEDGKTHHTAADHRNVEAPLHAPILH